MGDHIHNDLIDAVKHWGWRTCAIIKELDEAITCHNSNEYRTLLAHYEQVLTSPLSSSLSHTPFLFFHVNIHLISIY